MTEPNRNTPSEVTVFYDGSCPLCLAEIGHYKQADSNDALRLVDVSSDDFVGDTQITQQAAMAMATFARSLMAPIAAIIIWPGMGSMATKSPISC